MVDDDRKDGPGMGTEEMRQDPRTSGYEVRDWRKAR